MLICSDPHFRDALQLGSIPVNKSGVVAKYCTDSSLYDKFLLLSGEDSILHQGCQHIPHFPVHVFFLGREISVQRHSQSKVLVRVVGWNDREGDPMQSDAICSNPLTQHVYDCFLAFDTLTSIPAQSRNLNRQPRSEP